MDLDMERLAGMDPKAILEANIGLQFVFSSVFLICAFVVSQTWNAGFNVVLTGLIYIAYPSAAFYVLKNMCEPALIGALIGSGIMLSFISLMTAVYWGQLSDCESVSETISHYSCSQTAAYGAVSFFAVVMLLLQVGSNVFSIRRRIGKLVANITLNNDFCCYLR
jgi:hypothetical protein